jgi:hypothetical protein
LGLGSADFSYQYACCTLSATAARYSKNGSQTGVGAGGKAGAGVGDSEVWSLLATEFTSCVRRMKPEQTYALCLIVGGITPPEASQYSGCEMLFPLSPLPDQGVDILISSIYAAVQKQAVPLALGSSESAPSSTASLYTLTATQAHKLLPSVAYIGNYLDAVHSCVPPVSPYREQLLRHCLDSTSNYSNSSNSSSSSSSSSSYVSMEDVFVSILYSDLGTGDSVNKLLKAYVELDTSSAGEGSSQGQGQGNSNGAHSSKIDAAIASLAVKATDRVSHLLAATKITTTQGDCETASLAAIAAAKRLVCNSHLNFGAVTTASILRSLFGILEQTSSSSVSTTSSAGADVDGGGSVNINASASVPISKGHLDCCLAVTEALTSYLSNTVKQSHVEGAGAGILDLDSITRTGAQTLELLVTRRSVTYLQHLVESDYWREDSTPLGRIEVTLESAQHGPHTGGGEKEGEEGETAYYSLSSSKDREDLFLCLVSLASQVPPLQAVVAVRSIIRLLRAWGVSRSGSLKVALETSLSPVPLSSTMSGPSSSSYPMWMSSAFHMSSWGKIIELAKKDSLYLDIVELIITDIDITCSSNAQNGSQSETRYLAQTVAALAVDSTVPADFRHSVSHAAVSVHSLLFWVYYLYSTNRVIMIITMDALYVYV